MYSQFMMHGQKNIKLFTALTVIKNIAWRWILLVILKRIH